MRITAGSKNGAQLRLAIRRPNDSGFGSEEEKMSRIALSPKAAKLMKLCELEGYKRLYDRHRAGIYYVPQLVRQVSVAEIVSEQTGVPR